MPELPEVETVKRGLVPIFDGAVFARVHVRCKALRKAFPENFAQRLQGARITQTQRRAKYLIVETTKETLIWHLGMSGRVRIYQSAQSVPPAGKHDHVQFDLDTGAAVVFTDPRRFGLMELCVPGALATHPLLQNIGGEPLDAIFSGAVLAAALKGRRISIKQALMNARVVAGVGNIYASEALFHAGISPKRQARTVQGARAEKLVHAIKSVLQAAIEAGGSSLKDHRTTDGKLGYFQFHFAVYARTGEACPGCHCDVSKTGGIQRLEQGGRSTYYCPRKQR